VKLPTNNASDQAHKHKNWALRFSFSSFMTTAVGLIILVAFCSAGFLAYQTIFNNKLQDLWAIQFLELEAIANNIKIDSKTNSDRQISPRIPYTFSEDRLVSNNGKTLTFKDLRLTKKTLAAYQGLEQIIIESDGDIYQIWQNPSASSKGRNTVEIKRISPIALDFATKTHKSLKTDRKTHKSNHSLFTAISTIYIITREGKLVYSNDNSITPANMPSRQLVQKFIKAPFTVGQLEFSENNNDEFYGFFQEIPNSNCILFSETPKKILLSQVHSTMKTFGFYSAIILIFALLLLQYPLAIQARPLKKLLFNIKKVASGEFDLNSATANQKSSGFGEIKLLDSAFIAMGEDLATREKEIFSLAGVREEKIRLSSELAVAQSIQKHFLPNKQELNTNYLEMAYRYIPSSEVAGDWCGIFNDKQNQETTVIIADVMGHGAGSAMYTAVIAAIFEEYKSCCLEGFMLLEFANKLNHAIFKLGGTEWDASMIAAKYSVKNQTVDILSAGHVHPLLILNQKDFLQMKQNKKKKSNHADNQTHSSFMMLRGDLLGFSNHATFGQERIAFSKGSTMVLYSDGLTEVKNEAEKMYGKKGLRRSAANINTGSGEAIAEIILQDWLAYKGDCEADDDVCIAVMKAVA